MQKVGNARRMRATAAASVAMICLAAALQSGQAAGQDKKTLAEQVVGTWSYASVDMVRPDGSREPLFGPNPRGLAMFDARGRYELLTARSDLTKFASPNRMQGTTDENKAVVQGSIAHFGSYSINEADRTITFNIETSTFPNWNGTKQKRPFTVSGDTLTWKTPASTGGGTAEVVLKRVN
jgi:hypothetical protein